MCNVAALTASKSLRAAGALAISLSVAVASVRAQDGDAIAMVNGDPISRKQMVDALLEAHGVQMLQQMIVLQLAKAESARLKLHVTTDDVEKEFQRAVDKIAPGVDANGKALTQEEKLQALDMLLQRKGLTMVEFRLGMERNAHLRKAVEQSVHIDEALLREEYARLYGERVEVRHIQIGDQAALATALNRLAAHEDFAEIARTLSQNPDSASHGGLLPPFTFTDDEMAPALREQAFKLKPGEVSPPIQVGRWFHILTLERRIPASGPKLEEVRDKVQQSLRDRIVGKQMNQLITELFKKANVRVLDNGLRLRYEKILRESTLVEPTLTP